MNPANPIVPEDGWLEIRDGSSLVWRVRYENGFKIDGFTKGLRKTQVFETRGVPYAARNVGYNELTFSFEADLVAWLGDGTAPTLPEVVLCQGSWAAAVSTLPSARGDAFHHELRWGALRSGYTDALVRLPYVRLELGLSEGTPGKLAIKGTYTPFDGELPTHS